MALSFLEKLPFHKNGLSYYEPRKKYAVLPVECMLVKCRTRWFAQLAKSCPGLRRILLAGPKCTGDWSEAVVRGLE
eukprot:6819897-Alexandrium_andersonii.AAC.1